MDLFADQRDGAAPKSTDTNTASATTPWRILLIDDDDLMHEVTRLALTGFTFQGRPLELLSALSGQEAKEILQREQDIALALVDVVMETEHAGLDLVRYIRNEMNDHVIRLVLRTGQAGQAPEDSVIRDYDIDDYKEKTELTTQKLKTLLYSMLRSYRDLCTIEEQKQGLKRVIEASANVQNTTNLQHYATAVLEQLTSLLHIHDSAFYCVVQPRPGAEETRALTLAATGEYVDCYTECAFEKLPPIVSARCKQALETRTSIQFDDGFVLFHRDDEDVEFLLYVNHAKTLSELDQHLLKIYMQNIGLTFENLSLMVDLRETSKELVYNLANAVEARSKETGAHVQRVSLFCEKLGELYGLDEQKTMLMKHSSPLHDVGKVAIPDAILHKPGKLNAEEWDIMKKHVEYGVEILSHSKRRLILEAKEIAATQKIYDVLLQQFLVTLLLNGVKTLIVCALILWVFHQSVSQRVFAIAKHLRQFDPLAPTHEPLNLKHRKFIMEKNDELDWLADETNKITLRISNLYQNIILEQQRLADFTNAASDWLWETDATQRLTFCSEAMQSALAISIESPTKIKAVPALIHCASLLNKMDACENFTMCEEQITLDGNTYYFVFQGVAHFNHQGFVGFRGTAIDITELKQTQFELEKLNQTLEATVETRTQDLEHSMAHLKAAQNQLVESEKLAALGRLVAGVAHEVNTPLGIAVTANSVIKEAVSRLNTAFEQQTLTSQQYTEWMQQITDGTGMLENNLNRAARLIRDFKQTAVDQVSESRSQFRPVQTLDALVGSLHPETKKVPVTPVVEGDAELLMSSLPGVLTQVISNLVMNSVRHAFEGVSNPNIHIKVIDHNDEVGIVYTDNGVGVPPDLHQRIFEPFYTSKRGKGGSGLGLNLVFNLVYQKLQGQLKFDSDVNQGVAVTLTLPKFLQASPHLEDTEPKNGGALNE